MYFSIILIMRAKIWWHHNRFHIFYLVHTKGGLQKVARECTPTDHMDCVILSTGYTATSLPLGTPRNITQAESLTVLIAWVQPHLLTHANMLCECRCDTYFMGHFGLGIWWEHSFVRLTKSDIKVRSRSGQIRLNLQTQNFHSEAFLSCSGLLQDSKNDIFIYDD